MLYKRTSILSFLLLCSAFLFAQSEQETSKDKNFSRLDSLQYLQEIVVSGARVIKEIAPVQVLMGEDLERLNAHSVADALRYFSGVQMKDYGGVGGLKTINVRSLGAQHVGVFYDGVQIDNPQNGMVDLGKFSLDNMEAIYLYNGQKSAIFQPAKDFASASAVYLVSKQPHFKEGKNYNMKAAFKTGSFDVANPSILWEQKINKDISVSLSTEYMYTSGEYSYTQKRKFPNQTKYAYDTTAVRKNGEVKRFRLEPSIHGRTKGGEWKARLYFFDSKQGHPGAVVREEPGKFKHVGTQWDTNFFLQGSIKQRLSKRYTTLFTTKYAYDYMHYLIDAKKDPSSMHEDNIYRLYDTYFSSANMFEILPFWSANLSGDFQWVKMSADMPDFIFPQRYTGWVSLATSFNFNQLDIQGSLLATYVHEKKEVEKNTQTNWDKYTPTLIASWQPWEQEAFYVRAFYKKIFRMPTFNEMYFTAMSGVYSVLKPEYATQYNLGLVYSKDFYNSFFSGMEYQVDVYYNEITDKLMATPNGPMNRWRMENIGFVKIKGIDVSLANNFKLYKDLSLMTRLSYTYQEAQDYSDKEEKLTYENQIAYTPWHSGSAIAGLDYRAWSLNYSFIYTGKRYTESAHESVNRIKPWYTHDLSLFKNLTFNKTKLRLGAEVNNIFNQQYDVVLNYPMPGTNFKFIVNVTI